MGQQHSELAYPMYMYVFTLKKDQMYAVLVDRNLKLCFESGESGYH